MNAPTLSASVVAALVVGLATTAALMLSSGGASDQGALAGAASPPVALTSSCPPRSTTNAGALDIAGFAYCPAAVTVAVGDEVVWTNSDLAPHTVTYDSPDGPVDSGSLAQGQAWSTRFGHPGTYQYYCRFHAGMTGTIVVEASR